MKGSYWANAPLDRMQATMFSPTLDSMISDDDPVRLVEEVLDSLDWSAWEAEYDGHRGQPPIHPRHVAGAIMYGLFRGIRSSRKLEDSCYYRVDFMWLLHGRKIDHTTFAKFRTKFTKPLKETFKQIGKIAMNLGMIRLGEVAFDGTRVKANNGRYATRTAKSLEENLAKLEALFDEGMLEFEANDVSQRSLPTMEDPDDSSTKLPKSLADIKQRREQVQAALDQAKAADEARRKKRGVDPEKKPAQIPTTDPESRVMPNKEGGYAPNYTPTATTDGHRGFIINEDVTNHVNEEDLAIPAVDEIEETFGKKPENFLTDAGNKGGATMAAMEERDITFLAPVESSEPQEGNPALRDDPTEPVPESSRDDLPRNPKGQFDKSCFVYDSEADLYYCPLGNPVPFDKNKTYVLSNGTPVNRRIYRCQDCSSCSSSADCVSDSNKQGRTITRDQHEEVRERTAARMLEPANQDLYDQRPRIAETPFAILKSITGIRQFLLRGLQKVRTEWCWACTAFNLKKLVKEIARLRADFVALIANEEV